MKKQVRSFWYISALALFLSVALGLNAQTTPQSQPPDKQAQQPATPDQTTPPASTPEQAQPTTPPQTQQNPGTSQTPDTTGQAAPDAKGDSTAVQSFTGTIVKAGDKYMFQDAASGNTYDIDHQDEVQKFEGKRVKVKGTLDPSAKMIHIQ